SVVLSASRGDPSRAVAVPVLGSTGSATARAVLFVAFPATTTESDFSDSCITGYGSSPFPMRTRGVHPPVKPETSRFPCKELSHMPGSLTTPERQLLALSHPARVAFRVINHVGLRIEDFSR